jgi:hypothetical protein
MASAEEKAPAERDPYGLSGNGFQGKYGTGPAYTAGLDIFLRLGMIENNTQGEQEQAQMERFLGMIATIAESWLLILLPTLLVGAGVYFLFEMRPEFYRSESVLKLSKYDLIVLKSARVYGLQVDKAKEAGISNNPDDIALSIFPLDSPDVYNIGVIWDSPNAARSVLQGIVDMMLVETKPTEELRHQLDARLAILEGERERLVKSLERINSLYDRVSASTLDANLTAMMGNFGSSFTPMVAAISANETEIAEVRDLLDGTFSAGDVIQAPTLPDKAVPRTKGPFVILAMALTLAFLLVLVLVRGALMGTLESTNRRRIRNALFFRSKV